jgi:hypothetical protein
MSNRKLKPVVRVVPTGLWFVLLALFVAELLVYTWCHVQYVGVGYDIAELSKKQGNLHAMQDRLKGELARLRSPERFASLARDLGLVTPAPEQKVTLP